jgi:hypothetical protein
MSSMAFSHRSKVAVENSPAQCELSPQVSGIGERPAQVDLSTTRVPREYAQLAISD